MLSQSLLSLLVSSLPFWCKAQFFFYREMPWLPFYLILNGVLPFFFSKFFFFIVRNLQTWFLCPRSWLLSWRYPGSSFKKLVIWEMKLEIFFSSLSDRFFVMWGLRLKECMFWAVTFSWQYTELKLMACWWTCRKWKRCQICHWRLISLMNHVLLQLPRMANKL